MSTLLGIPVILIVVMVQTVVIRGLPLLQGTGDLVLLVVAAWSLQERVHSNYTWAVIAGLLVGLVSKVPWVIPLIGYLSGEPAGAVSSPAGVADTCFGDVHHHIERFHSCCLGCSGLRCRFREYHYPWQTASIW